MKKHLFWIVELFIWILILFLVSSSILLIKYNYKKNFNTYQIFLPDVDGLINGSPVKFMGIQIGYINQLNIVGRDVYVRFIVTNPDVKIPYGSTATVEFSGLGGSKSLEMYPPVKTKTPPGKLIIPQSPKRIHDSLGLLSDMFDKIIDITYTASHFMNEVGIIRNEATKDKIAQPRPGIKFLNYSNCWLDKAQNQCNKFNKRLKKMKEGKNGQNHGQIK